MLESFFIVGAQVLILFILIMVGYFCGKINMFSREGIKSINEFVLYIVNPCVIINAFQRPFNSLLLKNFLFAVLIAVIGHIFSILTASLIFYQTIEARKKVFNFAVIFSNCGFMALPLLDALLGSDGVFYGAAYLAVYNLLAWSYGQYIMARGSEGFSAQKIIINPGVIAVIIGLLMFFFSLTPPALIKAPIEYLASLNTPLPMVIIGYTISRLDLKKLFHGKEELLVHLLRLIVSPLVLLAIAYFSGMRGSLLIACTVSASAPTGAMTTMFSIKFGGDEELSARIVATSTLLSIITMTLIVGLARYIA